MQNRSNVTPEPADRWLRPAQVADMTGVSTHTLARWRWQGDAGPRFRKLGQRVVVYSLADVRAWIESNGARALPSPTAAA